MMTRGRGFVNDLHNRRRPLRHLAEHFGTLLTGISEIILRGFEPIMLRDSRNFATGLRRQPTGERRR